MRPFYSLSGRGRAFRLRRMALAALEHYDLEPRRVRLITNDMNGIFRVDTADGVKYVLRVSLPGEAGHTLEEIRSEMLWLAALRRDTDLGVPEPLLTHDGALVATVAEDGVPEPRHCAVFSWVPGPDLADRLTAHNVAKMGELSARLHDHAATFRPPEGFSIRTADSVFPFGEPVVLFDEEHRPLFPPARRAVYEQAMERAQATIDGLFAGPHGPRVVHYDLHQWNVKVHRGKPHAIDFEDLKWGYPVQDIAITLYYLQDRADYHVLREAFRHGYTCQRAWPERQAGEIEALMAGRGIELVNFVLQDPNPDWQASAPEFVERVERRLRAFLEAPR